MLTFIAMELQKHKENIENLKQTVGKLNVEI